MPNKLLLFFIVFFPQFIVAQLDYPESPKKPIVDVYHDVEVIDDYQWLENQESKDVKDWIKQQNRLSLRYLKKLARTTKSESQMNNFMFSDIGGYTGKVLNKHPKNKVYFRLFYNSNSSTPSLYYKMGIDDDYDMLVNTSNMSSRDDIEITHYQPSKNDKYLAYQYNRNGSDWEEIRIVKVRKRRFYREVLKQAKTPEILWLREGFFYEKYPFDSIRAKSKKPSIMYHKIDTDQSEDVLIFKSRKESEYVNIYGAPDESFFLIKKENIETKKFSYFYLAANDFDLNFKPFLMNIDYDLSRFDFHDNQIYASTIINEKRQLISIPLDDPYKFKLISPSYDNAVLTSFKAIGDNVLLLYTSSVGNLLTLVDGKGTILKETTTPNGLSVSAMGYDKAFEEFFFHLESYTIPRVLYKLDLDTFEYNVVEQTSVNFNPKGYKFIQQKFRSKDGTQVPINIVYKDTLTKNSKTPFLMAAYGGYGTVNSPSYNPGIVYFIENGGAFAYVDIRGGGTLGNQWWEEGKRLNKKNGITDFISAAEYLIEQNYTSPKKIAIRGTSHGGLITAASALQRPDIFGAAVVNVGVLDMLRFENFTVGGATANISEFGTVSNRQDFQNMYSYSPYHNINYTTDYPSMLITTGMYDNRVPPLHSFKFAARLQNNPSQTNPILLWTQKKTGHFGATNRSDILEENTYVYGFLFNALK